MDHEDTAVCRVLAQLQFDSWSVPIVVYGSLHWDDTSRLVIQPHSILGAGPWWCVKIRLRGLIKGGWWMCYGWPDVERVGKWGHFGIIRVHLHFACWNGFFVVVCVCFVSFLGLFDGHLFFKFYVVFYFPEWNKTMQEYQKFRAKQLAEGVCSFLVFVLKGWGWGAFQSFMSHLSSYWGICHDIY